MSNTRTPWILGGLVVLVIIFGWLRGGPRSPAPTTPAPAQAASPTTEATNPPLMRSRSTTLPSVEAAHAGVEPLPDLAPPNLELLRPERAALYQTLSAETNAVLAEVEAALRPFQASDPATLASAWTLANNWGIFAKGESTADQRIEDPVMRKQLADLHRRVLVEAAELELKAFLGGSLVSEIQSKLESIGRRHSSSASVRKADATQADADRQSARRRASAGEEPTE